MPGPVSNFPTAIQPMLQANFLQRALQEYLYPNVRYLLAAQHIPVPNHIGDTLTLTRPGLLAPAPDPVDPSAATGLDNNMTPAQWNIEQYTLTLQLLDGAQDIDLMTKEQSIVDRFVHSVKTNVIKSVQSLDIYTRNALFGGLVPSGANSYNLKEGYLSGTTIATAASSGTTMTVDDVTGFTTVIVNGVLTNVSSGNPLAIYKNGIAAGVTVIGATPANGSNATGLVYTSVGNGGRGMSGTLTLSGSLTVAIGDVITATDAPAIFRPNGKTHYSKIASTDTLGQTNILDAVAYLRNAQVPTLPDGTYLMVCDYVSMRQLFGDNDFKIAGQGLMKSDWFVNAEISRYLGVTIVQGSNAPVQLPATGGAATTIRRPIIMGADSLVYGHYAGIEDFGGIGRSASAAQANGAQMAFIETSNNGIAYVLRPPIDRLGRSMSLAYQAIMDVVVPTDVTANSTIILTGNNARRKRCAVIEHAG